jgi:hypothetical protein
LGLPAVKVRPGGAGTHLRHRGRQQIDQRHRAGVAHGLSCSASAGSNGVSGLSKLLSVVNKFRLP